MKNKKGFTLIELVITIAIMGILLIVIVPAISRYVNKGKDDYNLNVKKNIVQIAKDYYSNNSNELPKGQLDENNNPIYFTKLALTTLKYNNYVSENVNDANKNSCDNSFVIVENNNGNYEYHSCMICGDINYSSDDPVCMINLDNTSSETLPSCSVTYDNYDPNTWTNKDVILNITGSDSNGIAYFKIDDKQILPTKNNNGNYEAKYTATASGQYRFYAINKTGQRSFCDTVDIDGNPIEIKIDKDNPTCKLNVLEETETSKTLQIIGTDKTSEIKEITVNDKTIDFTNNVGIYITNANGLYKAVITDIAGNSSKDICSITIDDLDKTPPVIEFTQEGTQGEIAVSTCSDPESRIVGESVVKQTLAGTSDVTVTRTCTNNSGMTSTKSHTYKYNSCKTGSNTCQYGCDSCYDSCASTTTVANGCNSCTCYDYVCIRQNLYSDGTIQCVMYDKKYYTCSYCNICGTSYTTQCVGGYYSCGCSSCYSGSNTCKGGWNL